MLQYKSKGQTKLCQSDGSAYRVVTDQVIRDADAGDEHGGTGDADGRRHHINAILREQVIIMVLKLEPEEACDRNRSTQ